MQPCRMSAVALLKAYRSRALSPVEAMQDVLTRVAVFEPHIHATYLLEPERALKDARASEERWRRGEPAGPLDGVPTTIKDNIATKGEPVPLGTAASELKPAPVPGDRWLEYAAQSWRRAAARRASPQAATARGCDRRRAARRRSCGMAAWHYQ